MNKRYIWSALMIAAIAVACDSNTSDPEPTVPEPTPGPTVPINPAPSDSIPETGGPTHGDAQEIVITPADTVVSSEAQQIIINLYVDGEYMIATSELPEWLEVDVYGANGENELALNVTQNENTEDRVAELKVYSSYTEAIFTLTQSGCEPEQSPILNPADDSLTSSIGSMTGVDFVLGPIPMEVKGTLTYSVTCNTRNYTQGTLTISKSDLCSTLGITTADFDARKGNTIVCVPMNKDWSEGENTAGGSYGAWFGSSGTIGWGSSSIAYLEGNDMISFGYGMHPDNKSNSCVCRLQYQDKENEAACNVEVTVSLKQ